MVGNDQIQAVIPRLRRYARALTGERIAADDLVQDTLERAWRKLHLFRAGTDLRAWLFTVMHNVYVNQVRASKLRYSDDASIEELALREPDADGLVVRDLDRALLALPPDQREVVLWVALEDMSYEEGARTLEIPLGTVMWRLSRAREKLRGLMLGLPSSGHLRVVKS